PAFSPRRGALLRQGPRRDVARIDPRPGPEPPGGTGADDPAVRPLSPRRAVVVRLHHGASGLRPAAGGLWHGRRRRRPGRFSGRLLRHGGRGRTESPLGATEPAAARPWRAAPGAGRVPGIRFGPVGPGAGAGAGPPRRRLAGGTDPLAAGRP